MELTYKRALLLQTAVRVLCCIAYEGDDAIQAAIEEIRQTEQFKGGEIKSTLTEMIFALEEIKTDCKEEGE